MAHLGDEGALATVDHDLGYALENLRVDGWCGGHHFSAYEPNTYLLFLPLLR